LPRQPIIVFHKRFDVTNIFNDATPQIFADKSLLYGRNFSRYELSLTKTFGMCNKTFTGITLTGIIIF